jgi:hypothetical protein
VIILSRVLKARDVFLFGAGTMMAWSAIHLLREFVLVTESYVRAGLF